jgi:hypothetical protein
MRLRQYHKLHCDLHNAALQERCDAYKHDRLREGTVKEPGKKLKQWLG